MTFFIYKTLWVICTPLIHLYLRRRVKSGKEDPARLSERFGFPRAPGSAAFSTRPLWIHAASVGEASAALTLGDIAREIIPDMPLLFTTGTVTSAAIIQKRLPQNAVHQYAPYDHPLWVHRFLNAWKPRAALRVESELWPTVCLETARRSIPAILMNAQMSDRSFRRWQKSPRMMGRILSCFSNILADGQTNADRYQTLGAPHVTVTSNLKFISGPLPVDHDAYQTLVNAIAQRPCWMYASTHADEEKIAAQIHTQLKRRFPNLITCIALRHPARLNAVLKTLAPLDLKIECRSGAKTPAPDTDLYIIDTMGELGTFFTLAPITVMGRSFSNDGGGGHNPIEPAIMGSYPLSGPHVQNLKTIYADMVHARVTEIIETTDDMAARIATLLSNPSNTKEKGNAAKSFIMARQSTLRDDVSTAIRDILGTGDQS